MSERTGYLIRLCAIGLTPISSELSAIADAERLRYDQLSEADQLSDEGRTIADNAATLEAVAATLSDSAAALQEVIA